jgi:hypothetical protein
MFFFRSEKEKPIRGSYLFTQFPSSFFFFQNKFKHFINFFFSILGIYIQNVNSIIFKIRIIRTKSSFLFTLKQKKGKAMTETRAIACTCLSLRQHIIRTSKYSNGLDTTCTTRGIWYIILTLIKIIQTDL